MALVGSLCVLAAISVADAADFRVKWQYPTATGISAYRIYVREQGGNYGAARPVGLPPRVGDTMTADVTGLAEGPRYFFVVTAVDTAGLESRFSNEIGTCSSDALCDDNNACTDDSCSAGACRNTPVQNGTSCGDSNLCNGNETCQAGRCTSSGSPSCADGNACTTDSCQVSTGCTFTPIAGCRSCQTVGDCDDGNPCTRDGCLSKGSCSNTLIPGCSTCANDGQCDDQNECTTDRCTAGRCVSTSKSNGTSCADDDPCNGEEVCQAGVCQSNDPFPCDDGDPCTADRCGESGCTHDPSLLCEACAAVPRGEFEAQFVSFLNFGGSVRMTAIGFLKPAMPLDPVTSGISVELRGGAGNTIYRIIVPPGGFRATNTSRKAFRLDQQRARALRKEGLSKFTLLVYEDGMVRVYLRAKGKDFAVKQPTALTWNLMFGDQCGVSECRVAPNRPRCF